MSHMEGEDDQFSFISSASLKLGMGGFTLSPKKPFGLSENGVLSMPLSEEKDGILPEAEPERLRDILEGKTEVVMGGTSGRGRDGIGGGGPGMLRRRRVLDRKN